MRNPELLLFCLIVFVSSCKNGQEYNIRNSDQYEKSKISVEETEKNNPAKFLTVTASNKKNLLGQTVVRGSIHNNGKICHFKDVEILLSFYSKTGSLLEEDHDVVYESITPGGSTTFKSKYFAPKGTDSVGLKVLSAKF